MTRSNRVLMIADMSGYTSYLVGGEVEEAPLIAGDLVDTIVGQFAGDYELAGLEGDAVFVHAPLESVSGGSVLAGVARCYGAFRRRVESVRQATTCSCQACQLATGLDLKFFIHVGTASVLKIAGRNELSGRDVILVHRLLKDSVPATLGLTSYVLMTDADVQALDIDPTDFELERVQQSYDHFGEVTAYAGTPTDEWIRSGHGEPEPPGITLVDLERDYAIPATTLWELLTTPSHREGWEGIERVEEVPSSGERGVGTLSRCVARRLATLEEIIDWRPPNTFSRRTNATGSDGVTTTYELRQAEDATSLRVRVYGAQRKNGDAQALELGLREALERLDGVARSAAG